MGPPNCSSCSGPHAASAKDFPVWRMEKEIYSICIEKRISFPEARQLVEVKTPAISSPTSTLYCSVISQKRVKSVDYQTD